MTRNYRLFLLLVFSLPLFVMLGLYVKIFSVIRKNDFCQGSSTSKSLTTTPTPTITNTNSDSITRSAHHRRYSSSAGTSPSKNTKVCLIQLKWYQRVPPQRAVSLDHQNSLSTEITNGSIIRPSHPSTLTYLHNNQHNQVRRNPSSSSSTTETASPVSIMRARRSTPCVEDRPRSHPRLTRDQSVDVVVNEEYTVNESESLNCGPRIGDTAVVAQDVGNETAVADGVVTDCQGLSQRSQEEKMIEAQRSSLSSSITTITKGVVIGNRIRRGRPRGRYGHSKALFTTLIILGTYLFCWMPAVVFLALTCVDGCPFPLLSLSSMTRVLISFVCNSLVVLKAIVDPFIYTLRMKEVKMAIRKVRGIQ